MVFRLARYGAGVAADALAVINDESVSHEWGRVADWPIHINKPIGTVLAGFGAVSEVGAGRPITAIV